MKVSVCDAAYLEIRKKNMSGNRLGTTWFHGFFTSTYTAVTLRENSLGDSNQAQILFAPPMHTFQRNIAEQSL